MNWIPVVSAAFLTAFIGFLWKAVKESAAGKKDSPARALAYVFGLLLLGLLAVIWIIAGSDRLFRHAVPLEQRLVSYNESIRRRAQQELLGLETEAKGKAVGDLMLALRREDPFVRKWAAISLALIGPGAREAIPSLLQTVSDKEPDVAQASRVALTEIGVPDPHQIPALLQALQDPREPVRCEAAASLARMGPPAAEVIPVLLGYVGKPAASPVCFQTALAALAAAIPESQKAVIELLASGHRDVRAKAADILAKAKSPPADLAPVLLDHLVREKDAEIRAELAVCLALPSTPPEGLTPVYSLAFRKSKNPVVRQAALGALRAMDPPPEGVHAIWSEAIRDPEVDIRVAAAEWMRDGAYKTSPPLALLLRMLRDTDARVRRCALEALRASPAGSHQALTPIARAQRDQDPGVRCRAVETLVEWSAVDRIAVPLLIADLSRDEESARCAMLALGNAGHFHRGVIREVTKLLKLSNVELKSRALLVLQQLGPRAQDALPLIEQAEKDKVPGARRALVAIERTLPPKPRRSRRR